MLRLFPERLHIGMGQTYVAFALMRGKHILRSGFHACQADRDFNSQFSQLQEWLQQLQRPVSMHVFLAADTVHLTLLPWRDEITEPQQQLEVARAYFRQQWPDATEPPEVRVSSHGYGRPWLATALDRSILQRLKNICEQLPGQLQSRIKLKSIEPLSLLLAQSVPASMFNHDGWLAIAEHQTMVFAHYAGRGPAVLRSLPLHEVERMGLPSVLQRESRLAGMDQANLLMRIPAPQTDTLQNKQPWLHLAGAA